MIDFAFRGGAVTLADAVEVGAPSLVVKIRAELGIRPDHETIHLVERLPGVDRWQIERGQESTAIASWPVGTPVVFLPADAEPEGERTVHLAHALASNAHEMDLQNAYRRGLIDSEVVHDHQLVAETGPLAGRLEVARGQEGTTEVGHPAGTSIQWLAPGEG